MKPLNIAESKWGGYIGYLLEYVVHEQLLDENLWELFVKQYRQQNDTDNGWRGEYWGKMMRGAVLTYIVTGDEKIYTCMEKTVREILSLQESNGRISSYPKDKEFNGWDMWGRKYILLGNLYFYEICKEESLKVQIIKALSAHLDYIIDKIGDGEGKKSIFKTSSHYGAMNSCSILEPVVKMYKLTNKKSYLDFAKYIVENGFCEDMNMIDECLQSNKYPFEYTQKKAYEMMSCFQGLLEYYEVTGEEKYFNAVKLFADKIKESDITIIGCAGCLGEYFDNSAKTQTKFYDGDMQETCVTATWMNLCYKLLQMTDDVKYADWLECSALNAMGGAVNTEKQKASRALVVDGASGTVYTGVRDVFPFDSYSPLYNNRRGKGIGGFNIMEDGKSYGCCASIGSMGVAISGLFGVMSTENGLCVNMYQNGLFTTKIKEQKVDLEIEDKLLENGYVLIKPKSESELALKLRIPVWSETYKISLNGENIMLDVKNGYITLKRKWNCETVRLELDMSVKVHFLNGKVAFTKGAYVLASDNRLDVVKKFTFSNDVKAITVANKKFYNNVTVNLKVGQQSAVLCDYAQAGKNYDDENCNISVWFDTEI